MNSKNGLKFHESSSSTSSNGSDVTSSRQSGNTADSQALDSPKSLIYTPDSPLTDIDLLDDDVDSLSQERESLLNSNDRGGIELPKEGDGEQPAAGNEKPVSWRSLPRKDQLLVLTLARLSEPLTQTSLGSYLFYQLKSFDQSLPDSTISSQAGIIQAAFPAAQFLTAMLWGRYADSESGGRKKVIALGLLGTMFSVLGFGFSQNFYTAVFFRSLGGILNGNIGVLRTMISEIIKEKKFQSRAFLLLPMTFNIGVIIGPILGKFPSLASSYRLT